MYLYVTYRCVRYFCAPHSKIYSLSECDKLPRISVWVVGIKTILDLEKGRRNIALKEWYKKPVLREDWPTARDRRTTNVVQHVLLSFYPFGEILWRRHFTSLIFKIFNGRHSVLVSLGRQFPLLFTPSIHFSLYDTWPSTEKGCPTAHCYKYTYT
jgi:hypothetical protein